MQPANLYDSADILNACGIAFGAVFVLLIALAAIMQLITLIFPEERAALPASADPRAAFPKAASVPPPVPRRKAKAAIQEPTDRRRHIDPPVVAAISAAVASMIPGATVIRIEEES